jgi:predicted nucleic acid-binding protein
VAVDPSLVSRWFVSNPPFPEETAHVRSDFEEGKISFVAPENLRHEVAGAIHQAAFARRLNARRAIEQLERFLGPDLTLVESTDLVQPAFALSVRCGCSYYDAICLEIARRQGYPSIHADVTCAAPWLGVFPWSFGSKIIGTPTFAWR